MGEHQGHRQGSEVPVTEELRLRFRAGNFQPPSTDPPQTLLLESLTASQPLWAIWASLL